jgi:hypothetical protein
MSALTGSGTTPTILVTVLTNGERWLALGEVLFACARAVSC